MDIETLDVDGVLFVSCWALSYGDYDNSTQLYRRDNQPALEHTGLWPAERAAQGELGL